MNLIIGGGGIAEAIKERIGGKIVERKECDVSILAQVIDPIKDNKPDTVIFTAGISNPGPIKEVDPEFEILTNLLGAFNVARVCIGAHVKTMIFIASVAGLYGKPNHAGYSASKAGVISLVQSLAMEGHNAYAISPGRVDTPMRQKDYPNDTPGSRLPASKIAEVVEEILNGDYRSGDNMVIRKIGLDTIIKKVAETPWKDELAVGQPVTI